MSVWGKSPYLKYFSSKRKIDIGECLENLRDSERERKGDMKIVLRYFKSF
jgi:hypothetical protein